MVIGKEKRQRRITGLFTLRAHSGAPGFSRLGRSACGLLPTAPSPTLGRADFAYAKPLYARPNVVNTRNVRRNTSLNFVEIIKFFK
jgi:hypothetical protein